MENTTLLTRQRFSRTKVFSVTSRSAYWYDFSPSHNWWYHNNLHFLIWSSLMSRDSNKAMDDYFGIALNGHLTSLKSTQIKRPHSAARNGIPTSWRASQVTLCAFRSRCKLAGKNTLSNHSAKKRGKTSRVHFLRYSRRKRDTNGDLNNFESKHTFVFNEVPQKNLKRRDQSFYDESYFEATPSVDTFVVTLIHKQYLAIILSLQGVQNGRNIRKIGWMAWEIRKENERLTVLRLHCRHAI